MGPEEGVEEGAGDLESLATYLKGLANPKRLRLLAFLVKPHYLEEIASELGVARQTAQEHVQQLLELGVLQAVRGRRDHGPVTEYVVVPHRLFSIHEKFGKLGFLEPDLDDDLEFRAATSPILTGLAAPKEQDLPRLTIVHGMRIGRTMTLSGAGPWLVGRDPHALACLDYDPYVSTRHAEVRRVPGGFEIGDLFSSNGTYVDWRRMPRGTSVPLENGSVIRAGKSLLLFRKP